jgi:hypothetical protein
MFNFMHGVQIGSFPSRYWITNENRRLFLRSKNRQALTLNIQLYPTLEVTRGLEVTGGIQLARLSVHRPTFVSAGKATDSRSIVN